jgi:two-component system, cell cycle response regulator
MPKTILIIDDSVPLHKLIKAHLEPDDLKVKSAHEGESGLAAAARFHPSLIVLDVDMPRMNGFEVCRRLKANPTTAEIPIIFLTANPMVGEKVKAFNLGATDYITKPFKAAEFRARIRAALRAKTRNEAVAMVDGLTGLWNRAYLNLHLNSHISMAKRIGAPLACVVVKIDHFSALAVKHGEAVAGNVVRSTARILLSQCRAEDVVCRLDEFKFALLVTGANRAAAANLAERLRTGLQRQLSPHSGVNKHLTCSFGISDTLVVEETAIVERADAALRGNRATVGNCVMIAQAEGNKLYAAA